jgi:hypothetical protein
MTTDNMNSGSLVVVELKPASGNWQSPPDKRLALLLKVALRSFGFRCVAIREQKRISLATDGPGAETRK